MGTSQSKPSARGGSPLIPSWADQDPPPPGAPALPEPQHQDVLEPRRNAGFRRSLKEFYKTGDRDVARRALGHFARGSMGGGAAAGERLARAARIGGSAFSGIADAAAGRTPAPGAFDVRTLAGRPVSEAIAAIVDAFCPPGILDEDTIRVSMSVALAETFSGLDVFNPSALDPYAVLVAIRCFIAELVFAAVAEEQGQSASDVTPQQAVARENDLREVIRALTDVQATPIIQGAGAAMSPAQIEILVKQIATKVYEEIARW